jgi:hypothetical protein
VCVCVCVCVLNLCVLEESDMGNKLKATFFCDPVH